MSDDGNGSVLQELRQRGVTLQIVRDTETDARGLRAHPKSAITATVATLIKEHRDELLDALAACAGHTDKRLFHDEPAPNRKGWIRTTCKVCGRWLGYRPETTSKERKSAS